MIIAIDGPAASGKSTVGYRLAKALDYLFFDTGVMYRAVTWAALARGVAIEDEPAVGDLAHALEIDLCSPQPAQQDGRHATVRVDGQDVTWLIRAPEVDRNVSAVSAYCEVRRAMTAKQRQIAQRYGRGDADRPGIVLVGEGNPSRTRALLATETKKHEQVAYGVPVTTVLVGKDQGQVPLENLQKHLEKLPKALQPHQLTEVKQRLKALDAMRPKLPVPRGPMPTMKGVNRAMRGR